MTAWGFALAVSLAPSLQRRAAPGELPGAMAAAGLDPSGPLIQWALAVALPLVAAIAWRPRSLSGAAAVPLALAPLAALAGAKPGHVLALALFAALLLLRPARWSRRDLVLVPATISAYLAVLDLWPGSSPASALLLASAFVLLLRLFLPDRSFALAPLAFLLQIPPLHPLVPLAWITGSLFVPSSRRLVAYAVFPLAVSAYPLALLGTTHARYVDFFEDGHFLLPAAEMRRGELPYAGIVPVHGLLSDGGFDALAGGDDAGEILRRRRYAEALNLAAIYAVALAASGAAEVALVATFVSIALFPASTVWLRSMGGLFALAAVTGAVRLRSRRLLFVAGVLVVIACLFGMEFGVYAGAVSFVAALRWRPRLRALASFSGGVAAAGIPLLIAFAIGGFADDMVRVTFRELLPAGRLYVPAPLTMPEISPATIGWCLALLVAAAMFGVRPFDLRRRDTVWIVALWIVVAALSWAQRRHLYFTFALVPFFAAAIWSMRRQRALAAAAAVVLLLTARPFAHLFEIAAPLRRNPGSVNVAAVAVPGIPRAAGALFRPDVAEGLQRLHRVIGPAGTFFDFTNSAALYYFLARDCLPRHHQVPFYESDEGQREVLERIAGVRYIVTGFPGGEPAIDGVANRVRAPLVWRWIEAHYAPLLREGALEVWERKDLTSGSAPRATRDSSPRRWRRWPPPAGRGTARRSIC